MTYELALFKMSSLTLKQKNLLWSSNFDQNATARRYFISDLMLDSSVFAILSEMKCFQTCPQSSLSGRNVFKYLSLSKQTSTMGFT